MAELSDDELGVIFRLVSDPIDRRSISTVSKQWLRVEGLTRLSVRVLRPDLLSQFIRRFPNLTTFESSAPIDDSKLVCLASYCPKLETLNLSAADENRVNNHAESVPDDTPAPVPVPTTDIFAPVPDDSPALVPDDSPAPASLPIRINEDDVSDVGLYAVAKWCTHLTSLSVRNRPRIGDIGVFGLARFLRNLHSLDLSGCVGVTDQALLALGWMGSIRNLSLQGCTMITDKGLAMLSFEPLSKSLSKLDLAGCDQISDLGIVSLSKMTSLEELNLGGCGSGITELGGLAISRMATLKRLNLSKLSIADLTLVMVSGGCQKLVEVDITACQNVTGYGVCAFSTHKCLEAFVMGDCSNVSLEDVKQLVLGCSSLKRIGIDGKLRSQMTMAWEEVISIVCRLDWM